MKKMLLLAGFLSFVFSIAISDPYLITANKIKQKRENVTENVIVISKKVIEKRGLKTVNDVLNSLSTFYVPKNGLYGLSSPKISGDSLPLIMIDGVPLKDPSGIGRQNGNSNILLNDVAKIEIISGNESTIYGTFASSGVVNIITEKPKSNKVIFSTSYGSYKDYTTGISVSNVFSENLSMINSIKYQNAEGKSTNVNGKEKDGVFGTNFLSKFFYKKDKMNFSSGLHYIYNQLDLDNKYIGWSKIEDPSDYYQKLKSWDIFFNGLINPMEQLSLSLNSSYSETNREYVYKGKTDSEFKGKFYNVDIKTIYDLNKNNKFLLSFTLYDEFAKTDSFDTKEMDTKNIIFGYFGKVVPFVSFNFSGRVVIPSKDNFDTKFIYKAGISQKIVSDDSLIILKLNYGTGYNLPTLFNLYAPIYGNKDLDAETSKTIEAVIDNKLFDNRLSFSFSYKKSIYENLIYYKIVNWTTYEGKYFNGNKNEIDSYSVGMKANPIKNIKIYNNYTHNTANDISNGQRVRMKRVPSYTNVAGVEYNLKRFFCAFELKTIGERVDGYMNSKKLDPFTLLNASFSYNINKNLKMALRIENITSVEYDVDSTGNHFSGYVLVPGYSTPDKTTFNFSLKYSLPF